MVNVEYDQGLKNPRKPLIPVVNPDCYAQALRCVGIPDKDIPSRTVLVSSKVIFDSAGARRADHNPESNLVTLYPEVDSPDYLKRLALFWAKYRGSHQAIQASREATGRFHTGLVESLLHETKHDGDNHLGIDFGETAVSQGLTAVFFSAGALAGGFISSYLVQDFQPLIHGGAALAIGVPYGLAAGYNRPLANLVDPIEIRARLHERKARQIEWKGLVTTVPNPNVDLYYRHNFPRRDDSQLSITNGEILELRGF